MTKVSQEKSELRIWLAIRTDLAMSAGKIAVQAGHGFTSVIVKCDQDRLVEYIEGSQVKVAVKVASLAELRRVAEEAARAGLTHVLVTDEGRTEFEEPTETVCAFGPARPEDLPSFLKRLRLF